MDTDLSYQDLKQAMDEIKKGFEENRAAFEFALLCHEQGIVTDKTKENVTKASVLAWCMEKFKHYPLMEEKPINV